MPHFCGPFQSAQLGPEHQSKGRSVAVELTQRKANKLGMWLGTWFRTSFRDDDDAYCARARRSRRSPSRHRCCCRCTRAHRLLRRARDIEGEHVHNAAGSFSFSSVSISLYSHKLSLLILYYIYFTLLYFLLCLLSEHVLYAPLCARNVPLSLSLSLSLSHILLFISRLSLSPPLCPCSEL
jgi:hypothetical protein